MHGHCLPKLLLDTFHKLELHRLESNQEVFESKPTFLQPYKRYEVQSSY